MNASHRDLSRAMLTALVSIAALAVLVVLSNSASAHEHVTSGDLEFVVGWGTEPAVIYQQNTVEVGVQQNLQSGSVMLENVADNLTVTISTGPVSQVKAVDPKEDSPGWYNFPIVPTRVGTYTIRITGTINGTAFDVSVDPEDVVSGQDVNFPVSDPTSQDLNETVATLQAQIAALQGGGAGVTQAQLDDVTAQASTATLLAVVGVLIGVAGVAVGAVGMRKGKAKDPKA